MAEIIPFPGTDSQGVKLESETIPNLSALIKIPSLEDMYSEELVMVESDMSVAAMRIAFEEGSRTRAIQGLESALAEARGKYILANLPKGDKRRQLLVDLAKNTYAAAKRVESTELMDWAANELREALGIRRAMIVIENIQIKEQLDKRD